MNIKFSFTNAAFFFLIVQAAMGQKTTAQCALFDCPTRSSVEYTKLSEAYVIRDGLVLVEGDIAIAREEDWSADSTVRGLITTDLDLRWPNGIVNFVIDAGVPTSVHNNILAAIADVEADTAVQFVEGLAEDYIRFRMSDDPNSGVCSSFLGRVGGEQPITLIPACGIGTIIHEIGHAIGLFHEHNRPDRDDFVTVNFGNICSTYASQFFVTGGNSSPIGPYDYDSIMHYTRCTFSVNGLVTIQAPQPIGQRNGFSEGDINTIALMYGDDSDNDGDGVGLLTDNCPLTPNSDQRDTDADFIGNSCDPDFNGDGVVNVVDLGMLRTGFFSAPGDSNWHQNLDLTGDDVVNAVDLGVLRQGFFAPPGPGLTNPANEVCPGGGAVQCGWQPSTTASLTSAAEGLLSLTFTVSGPGGLVSGVQWQLNGGPWQSGNVSLNVLAGTAEFCAPGPGEYRFRSYGFGDLDGGGKPLSCSTGCGAPSNPVTLPGEVLPTCSAGLPAAPDVPGTPTITNVQAGPEGALVIFWTPVVPLQGTISYEYEYTNDFVAGGNSVVLGPATTDMVQLPCNGNWTFRIQACASNAGGTTCGAFSPSVTVGFASTELESCTTLPQTGPITAPAAVLSGTNYTVSCETIPGITTPLRYKIFESLINAGDTPGPGPVAFSPGCTASFSNSVDENTPHFYWSQACELAIPDNCGPYRGPTSVLVLGEPCPNCLTRGNEGDHR